MEAVISLPSPAERDSTTQVFTSAWASALPAYHAEWQTCFYDMKSYSENVDFAAMHYLLSKQLCLLSPQHKQGGQGTDKSSPLQVGIFHAQYKLNKYKVTPVPRIYSLPCTIMARFMCFLSFRRYNLNPSFLLQSTQPVHKLFPLMRLLFLSGIFVVP